MLSSWLVVLFYSLDLNWKSLCTLGVFPLQFYGDSFFTHACVCIYGLDLVALSKRYGITTVKKDVSR